MTPEMDGKGRAEADLKPTQVVSQEVEGSGIGLPAGYQDILTRLVQYSYFSILSILLVLYPTQRYPIYPINPLIAPRRFIYLHKMAFFRKQAYPCGYFDIWGVRRESQFWMLLRSYNPESFSCEGQDYGYFADVESGCEVSFSSVGFRLAK